MNDGIRCMIVLLIMMVSWTHAVNNEAWFFPSSCPTNGPRECCPEASNGLTCGGESRGTCRYILDDDSICDTSLHMNALWWVTDHFDSFCVCNDHFYGVSCDECAAEWEGPYCNETRTPVVRRDFRSLSDDDRQYVVDAFIKAKTVPSPYQPSVSVFDFIASQHYWAMVYTTRVNLTTHPDLIPWEPLGYGHSGPAAPTFHRRMIFEMERGLQYVTGNSSFAMPYWNWTGSEGNENDPTLFYFGGDGDPNEPPNCRMVPYDAQPEPGPPLGCTCLLTRGPFAHWPLIEAWGTPLVIDGVNKTIERAFGCQTRFAPGLPTHDSVDYILTFHRYDYWGNDVYRDSNFRNLLGGGSLALSWPRDEELRCDMHKRVHRWVAGSLVGNYSASDPLFYMLHSYADVVLEQWIRSAEVGGYLNMNNSWQSNGAQLGHNRYECQAPFVPLIKQVDTWVKSTKLGYTFDIFESVHDESQAALYTPFDHPIPTTVDSNVDFTVTPPYDTSFFLPSSCDASNRTCCPSSHGAPCGGSSRGACTSVSDITACDLSASGDWLTSVTDFICICATGYTGVDCSTCVDGYTLSSSTGACIADAASSTTRIRRRFSSLNNNERQHVYNAIITSKVTAHPHRSSVSIWDHQASQLLWATNHEYVNGGPAFVSWHRQWLKTTERLIGNAIDDASFALPYWQWNDTLMSDNEAALRWFGGDGDPLLELPQICRTQMSGNMGCNCTVAHNSTFGDWLTVSHFGTAGTTTLRRAFGCLFEGMSLPTRVGVHTLLARSHTFDSNDTHAYHRLLEGRSISSLQAGVESTWPPSGVDMMARVMAFIGGTANHQHTEVSPASDPLYLLAHVYADRLTEEWLRTQAVANDLFDSTTGTLRDTAWTTVKSGHGSGECMPSFYPLVLNRNIMALSTHHGYDYDVFVTTASSASSTTSADTAAVHHTSASSSKSSANTKAKSSSKHQTKASKHVHERRKQQKESRQAPSLTPSLQ